MAEQTSESSTSPSARSTCRSATSSRRSRTRTVSGIVRRSTPSRLPRPALQGREAKPIEGGTAAGFLFLDTHGEKRLDQAQVHTLIQELEAARRR
jgi:hypothetical protein